MYYIAVQCATYTYTHASTYAHIHVRTTHIHTRTYARTYTHTYIYIPTYPHTLRYVCEYVEYTHSHIIIIHAVCRKMHYSVHYRPYSVQFTLYAVHCRVCSRTHITQGTSKSVPRTLYVVHRTRRTLYTSVRRTVYTSIRRKLYICVRRTVYAVHCTIVLTTIIIHNCTSFQ